jgi:diaminohydroxyphosphoribosylaminopyrimidine deaminase/5-amino-6-(5-phosphoribosylamino)uracil reductase
LQHAGATVLRLPHDRQRVPIGEALTVLAGRGITRLLVEGGPSVAASFLDAGVVDEVLLFMGAKSAGPDGLPAIAGADLDRIVKSRHFTVSEERATIGGDRMTRFRARGSV